MEGDDNQKDPNDDEDWGKWQGYCKAELMRGFATLSTKVALIEGLQL